METEEEPLLAEAETGDNTEVDRVEVVENGWDAERFLMLGLLCFLNFGNYFCYDNPAALQDKFTADGMGLSQAMFGLLYTVYAWPNVIFPLIGGVLIDGWLGRRLAGIVFAAFILCGQLTFACGGLLNSVGVMLAGRVLHAVGGESLLVCQRDYAVSVFKGRQLNSVFGLLLSFERFVSKSSFLG